MAKARGRMPFDLNQRLWIGQFYPLQTFGSMNCRLAKWSVESHFSSRRILL